MVAVRRLVVMPNRSAVATIPQTVVAPQPVYTRMQVRFNGALFRSITIMVFAVTLLETATRRIEAGTGSADTEPPGIMVTTTAGTVTTTITTGITMLPLASYPTRREAIRLITTMITTRIMTTTQSLACRPASRR